MHINNEVTHEHTHEHTHADGVTHSHAHIHTHDEMGHSHEGGEGHTHTHDGSTHTHSHEHTHAQPGAEQTKALLSYMLHHNEHHAEELAGMLDALPAEAREKLTLAIGTFEAANVQLAEVLESLK